MESVLQAISKKYTKSQVVDVRPGDSVKVHQKIREGGKERIQIFQGLVLRVTKKGSNTNRILVRRIASGVGVEKSFLMHSPSVIKVEVTKRSKTNRNYLTYMRERTGKSTRLTGVEFDSAGVNTVQDDAAEEAEKQAKEDASKQHEIEAKAKAQEAAKEEAQAGAALEAHEAAKQEDADLDKT
jgi:large subunit ribosomal protein L19